MKKYLTLKATLMLILAATLFAACVPLAGQKGFTSLETLYSGTWHLVAYGNKEKTVPVTPGLKTFLAFEADGNLYGNGGCNNFFGSYKVTKQGSFKLTEPVGSTLMFCEGFMDEEATFLAAIQSAKSAFVNEDDQLVINFKESAAGYNFMLFVNRPTPTLRDTDWVLSSLITSDGDIPVPSTDVPWLNLSEKDGMYGNSGCNTIGSSFEATDRSISFGMIASTMMYCEGLMDLELSFTNALEAVSQYEIIEDQLVLSSEDFTTVMTFFTADLTLENTQWRLYTRNGEDIPADIHVSLTLSPEGESNDGTVSGSAGCNNYTGSYVLDGDHLTINLISLTAKFCDTSMDIEAAFIEALQDELVIQMEKNRLILTSDYNMLHFLGEAPSPTSE